jgi:hypothetical protein
MSFSLIIIVDKMEANNIQLTDQEILFCELYANGEAPFAGNAAKCYREVYNDSTNRAKSRAIALLARPDIQAYLKSLDELSYEEAKYMKTFLRENLLSIVKECSVAEYRDRKGTLLSPAALRSVAVSGIKALMDLYPVKEASVSKLSIDGAGEGGITFNVIMPEQSKSDITEK